MSLLLCQFTKMHLEKDTDTLKLDNQFHEILFSKPKLANPQH